MRRKNRQVRDGGTRRGDEVRAPSRPAPQQAPYHAASPPREIVKDILPESTPPPTIPLVCCVCGAQKPDGRRLRLYHDREDQFVACNVQCANRERARRLELRRQHRVKLPMSAEELAKRLERLAKARIAKKEKPWAIRLHMLTGDTPVSHRHHQVLMYHLMGLEPKEIAEAVGLTNIRVSRILNQPHILAAIRKVEAMQLERIVSGEFGVQAAARANAGKAMSRIINEVDNADAKPAERLKASELNLKLSGDLVDKRVNMHLHTIVKGFSDDELREFVQHKKWPERVRPLIEKLGLPAPDAKTG